MSIIPAPFLFRAMLPVPRVDVLPRAKAPLLALPESCRVPFPSQLDGQAGFSELRMAWNPEGLAISVQVTGTTRPPVGDSMLPEKADGCRIWIDTRDTRSIHRASRFCHLFTLLPVGSGAKGDEPTLLQHPVPRAAEDAPEIDPDDVLLESSVSPKGWQVAAWFPAHILHGYDPVGVGRLGFYLHVRDKQLGHEYFSVGEDFPFAADPTLWTSLELNSPE